MHEMMQSLNYQDRRRFMEYAAKAFLGVSILPAGSAWADNKNGVKEHARPSGGKAGLGGKAKNVIYIFMEGAMSHIDTLDPKTNKDVAGDTTAISTKTTGIQFGKWLPKLAEQSDKMTILRSLYTQTADHVQAQYLMHTSYKQIASIVHPAMGSWAMRMLGARKKSIPDNIVIGAGNRHPGAGYMDPSFSPVPIGDANRGLQNTTSPNYLTDDAFDKRMALINKFDQGFQKKYPQKQVEAYNEFYRQAIELMSSQDLKAFDLNQEKPELRDKYGRNNLGQGCLLARRLVQADCRFIEVNFGSWDMHNDITRSMETKSVQLDQALSSLLEDLASLGMLDSTLVVLTTEFGRSPKINENNGRDHHPGVFSSILAGGGIKGGLVYGSSDDKGHSPEDDAVTVQDFNATIAKAMGIDTTKEIYSNTGRPFRVADDGEAIDALYV
jgi:hypothetical protein